MSAENRSGIRGWRNREQFLRLKGEICPGCDEKIFPPRDICPKCRTNTVTGEPFFKETETSSPA